MYRRSNWEDFKTDLSEFGKTFINSDHTDSNSAWNMFKSELNRLSYLHIPTKMIRSVSGHTLRTTKHKWSSGFMVLDVSYSRVLGQRPTFYCPLLAVSCPEVWARMYRHIYTVQSMYNVHTKKQNNNNNTTTGRWSHRWSRPTGYLSS